MSAQHVRFCTGFDCVRLAYAVTGIGPSLVNAPHWLSHLEHELQCSVRRPWFAELSRRNTLLRFDQRGCGLSDWQVEDISFEAMVRDLECVVAAAGFDRFALLGNSQGAAIAVEYAARHPERVTHLVLWGGYARGRLQRNLTPQQIEDAELRVKLIEFGWAKDESSYRDVFSRQLMPGGNIEQLNALSELQRVSSSPTSAAQILRAHYRIDVRCAAERIKCPTLVLHARGDRVVPVDEGRLFAALIPGALFVTIDTDNHILLSDEPAWRQYFDHMRRFLSRPPMARAASAALIAELTPREVEILERIAQGLDNAQIAAHLALSEKTVRNHITHIFDKLQVENRSRAIVLAREAGFS
jgi:pimeloyl-ACP methyl ester carboxylesterase/DNA-binding CsgD family transcriptional regulator